MQNTVSDNTSKLWNRTSIEKVKKESKLIDFFRLYSQLLGMCGGNGENLWNCNFLNFNKI